MEFTPKKQIISTYGNARHTPYSTGGRTCNKSFKKRIEQSGSPRTSHSGSTMRTYRQKRIFTRTERILSLSSKTTSPSEEKNKPEKLIDKNSPAVQTTKRPFSAVNTVENIKESTYSRSPDGDVATLNCKKKPNDENDPYKFCPNVEHEIYDKITTDMDKENSIFSPPRAAAVKSYPSKKKQIDLSRSRLVYDFSPEKLEKAYGPMFMSGAEKENVPAETRTSGEAVALPGPATTLPYLIGFPNYGNTCYLNSVLQALFGLPSFLGDLQLVSAQLNLPTTSLSSGLTQVITARTKGQVTGVKQALKTVKENLVRVDGSFSGYKMQDANEFLTRILDTIKDEIDRCHMTTPSPDRPLTLDANHLTSNDEDLDEIFPSSTRCRKLLNIMTDDIESEINSEIKDSNSCRVNRTNVQIKEKDSECEDPLAFERMPSESKDEIEQLPVTCPQQATTPSKGCGEETLPRNPVKDNFEFQLFESYRCIGCNEVEGRRQEYFGLYVNLPEEGHESIQDALSSCMGEDERELKCEKCGHNRSSVVTTVTRLPRVLVVQLKRYEYKADQGESIKRSWRVPVTRWLTLDDYVTEDGLTPSAWCPQSCSNITPKATKQTTLTVRNLSSELNVCEGRKEQEEPSACSPSLPKPPEITFVPATSDKEDEELQEVMRRSMDDFGGTKEEDEIQQAIRLSLQDLGMSYTQENQGQTNEAQVEEDNMRTGTREMEEEKKDEDKINSHRHTYRLISVISHFGRTTNTGHYVADVYNCEEDSWFHYDDEAVSKIPENVVFAEGRQKNGYIFFYVHKDLYQKIQKKANLHR